MQTKTELLETIARSIAEANNSKALSGTNYIKLAQAALDAMPVVVLSSDELPKVGDVIQFTDIDSRKSPILIDSPGIAEYAQKAACKIILSQNKPTIIVRAE